MAAQPQATSIWRGEPLDLDFAMSPPQSIAGWSIVFSMTTKPGVEPFHTQAATVLDENAGTYRVSLSGQLTDRDPRSYWWDVWKTGPGTPRLLAIGYTTIRAVVRRPIAAA